MERKVSYAASAARTYQQRSTKVFHATSQSPWYVSVLDFNLPEMLTNEYFDRHKLSIHDYERILQSIRRIHFLHALALSKNVPIVMSNTPSLAWVKVPTCPSASNLTSGEACQDLVKRLVAKRLDETRRCPEVKTRANRLVCPFDKHALPLPVHFISSAELKAMPSFGFVYPRAVPFVDIDAVPQRCYHGYLKMVKVITKHKYELRYGPCRSVAELPREYIIGGELFYDTEEAFLFQTEENHKALCSMTESDLEKLSTLYMG
jgi:hypothetical protein